MARLGKALLVMAICILALQNGVIAQSTDNLKQQNLPNIFANIQAQKSRPSPRPSPKPSSKPSSNSSSKSSGGFLDSLLGFIVGPILFISAFPMIWYNERKAAIDMRRINLGKSICVDVDVNDKSSAEHNDGKLVYAKGQTRTSEYTSDQMCGVGGYNLLKITRTVEVLQWRKKTKKKDDQQQVYYQMEWVQQHSSDEGRFNNPANWFIKTETIYNQRVFLGGYNITKDVIDLCQRKQPFVPARQSIEIIKANCSAVERVGDIKGDYIYFTPSSSHQYTPPPFDNYQAVDNKQSQIGQTVGTLRVKFQLCPTGPMSMIGKANVGTIQGTLQAFNIAQYEGTLQDDSDLPTGPCCCMCNMFKQYLIPIQQILVVEQKDYPRQGLFDQHTKDSNEYTLIFRIGAYLAMVIGICLFFSPITTILGYIPLVGGFIKGIAMFAIIIGAVLFCIPIFTIAFSLAWLRFNPKIGLIILSVGLLILGYFWLNGKPTVVQPPAT